MSQAEALRAESTCLLLLRRGEILAFPVEPSALRKSSHVCYIIHLSQRTSSTRWSPKQIRYKSLANSHASADRLDRMHLMYNEDPITGNRIYTLKKVLDGVVTKSAHPARFSPDDKYSRCGIPRRCTRR